MKTRIELLDLWRSLCVFLMLGYHLLYDLAAFGYLDAAVMSSLPLRAVRGFGGGSFILISGAALCFSAQPLRRGFFLLCVGAAMTAATAAVGYPAAFGVLELLGVCQMVFGALRPRLERVRLPYLAAVAAIAFALTAALTARVTVAWRWLYPLGLKYPGFYSSDYYPVFPWAFLFLLGFCLGRRMAARREELPLLSAHFPPALTFAGRHSLLIYLVHQPLFWGVLTLLQKMA